MSNWQHTRKTKYLKVVCSLGENISMYSLFPCIRFSGLYNESPILLAVLDHLFTFILSHTLLTDAEFTYAVSFKWVFKMQAMLQGLEMILRHLSLKNLRS